MKPYYQDDSVTIYHGDCREIVPQLGKFDLTVTDPPYNIGYHYIGFGDNLSVAEYGRLLFESIKPPCLVIHYPEDMFFVSSSIGLTPSECAAWVYNAHMPRKWRMAAWFGFEPDFGLIKQPYKNQNDKRIAAKIEAGSEGCDSYDWFQDEQVKNVSEEKTEHPCQIPLSVMTRLIALSNAQTILDPFAGSGTTGRAAKDLGRKCTMIELEERYCEISAKRMSQEVLPL